MKTSHTPGPWKIEHERDRFDSSFDTLAIVEGKEDGRIVLAHLNVRAFVPHLEEPEANARLIAAAPELLEALQECITSEGAACFSDMQNHPERMQRRLYAIADIARAAIAKATQP